MKTVLLLLVITLPALAQISVEQGRTQPVRASQPSPPAGSDRFDELLKRLDDLMWYTKLGDIADVDQVQYTSLPREHVKNPKAPGAVNPLIIHAYTFIPKHLDKSKKQPLIVLIHGGVHANFDTSEAHIVRELVAQGYSIVSSDYRGSTGYGRAFYEDIDYGGREVDDVFDGATWMLQNYEFLDSKRVGIMGWSHGGLITLMNIFQHPNFYAVAYAGVPVSDLVARLGYQTEAYQNLYSAPYHIGKTVREDIGEYRKRSPVNHVKDLQIPLLVHTNTADEDVNVLEVEHLIDSLKAEGKKFEYKIYENAPGGHHFNRTDTQLAKDSRREVYRFLAGYLHPVHPVQ
jgi:dipeptidyl aminopeptidase/acylaminoacyl peptidase